MKDNYFAKEEAMMILYAYEELINLDLALSNALDGSGIEDGGKCINVNDFYDNSINTTGELLSTLISIEKQTDMKISGKKNKDGKYDPNSINISFTNKDVNALLAEYLSYKDQYKETENESGELEKLILTDTPIEKAAK